MVCIVLFIFFTLVQKKKKYKKNLMILFLDIVICINLYICLRIAADEDILAYNQGTIRSLKCFYC